MMETGVSDSIASPFLTANTPGTMKWYGWGVDAGGFEAVGRPGLWPYAKAQLGLGESSPATLLPAPESIALPNRRVSPEIENALVAIVGEDGFSCGHRDRLLHAYGKSTRDVWRIRHGRVDYAPDAVAFPQSEEQIIAIVRAAGEYDVALVPFGGGTNVAGCLELAHTESRFVLAVNLRRYNRVLDIDAISGTVRAQSGILGPDLELALEPHGLTLGHFPDSFTYSTLGGWIATRSSGMLSDGYGNPEEMLLSLRMATPAGMIETRDVPHASNGVDPKRLCIGSEGALGIITEVTMSLRAAPIKREFRGYLFPDFASGIEAMRACMRGGAMPAMTRLNDIDKTHLTAAFRRASAPLEALVARLVKRYLRDVKKLDLKRACLLIAAFEGDAGAIRWQRRRTERLYKHYGGIGIGPAAGNAFAEGKFDFPYIRDFLIEHDVVVDVCESSTVWSNVVSLYDDAMTALRDALGAGGRRAWVGCHASHSYAAGTSLYFSFAFTALRDADGRIDPWAELAHHAAVKQAALNCFSRHRATLSHHHAVGTDHLPWLAAEAPVAGGTAVDTMKAVLDPQGIMNPGKLTTRSGDGRR